jgi:hypothetical protein
MAPINWEKGKKRNIKNKKREIAAKTPRINEKNFLSKTFPFLLTLSFSL